MTVTAIAGIVMIALIFVTLAFGFPIGLSIGLGSAAALYIIMPNQGFLTVSAQKMFQSVNSFSLLAIPFFVLAGNIMNTGGIARRLVGCAKLVAHRLPGALAQTNIVANMLFGAMSGSGVAAAVAMGGILGPMEKEEGYSDEYIAVCNIASGPTGMMIPPSNIIPSIKKAYIMFHASFCNLWHVTISGQTLQEPACRFFSLWVSIRHP